MFHFACHVYEYREQFVHASPLLFMLYRTQFRKKFSLQLSSQLSHPSTQTWAVVKSIASISWFLLKSLPSYAFPAYWLCESMSGDQAPNQPSAPVVIICFGSAELHSTPLIYLGLWWYLYIFWAEAHLLIWYGRPFPLSNFVKYFQMYRRSLAIHSLTPRQKSVHLEEIRAVRKKNF